MHSKYIEMINGALRNQDNATRTNSENCLMQERARQPIVFFETCTDLLVNQSHDLFIRQSASTLLANSIGSRNSNGEPLWDSLPVQVKGKLKQEVLGTLISNQEVIVRSTANVISKITVVEIPRGQWLDLIDILAENTSHDELSIRRASITAIGSICQELHFHNASLNERTCEQFLGGIIIGTRETQISIIHTALTALKNSLYFLQPIMAKNKDARNEVFKLLINRVKNQGEEQLIYEVFFQFVRSCYDFLYQYIEDIKKMTLTHLGSRDQVSVLAMQLWESIGHQYVERLEHIQGRVHHSHIQMNNYLFDVEEVIMPEIMGCLLIQNQGDLDFPEMRESALKVLGTFVACGKERTIDKIGQGVNAIISSTNPGHRQATVLLFSTLCESTNKDYVYSYFQAGFDSMFTLVNDPQNIVISNSLSGFSALAEIFPQAFYHHKNIRDILFRLMELLNSDDAAIVENSLNVLRFISEGISVKTVDSVISTDPMLLLQPMVNYFEIQLDRFQKDKERENREKAVIIIMNCLMKNRNKNIGIQLIQFLIQKYFEIVEINHVDKQMMIQSILAILHTAILTLEGTVPSHETLNNLNNLVGCHVQRFGVQAQGLNIISALGIVYGNELQYKADEYWTYILHGMESTQHAKTFKASLHCAGDYGRIFKDRFEHKIMDLMNRFIGMIHTAIPREFKTDIIATIGDFVLGLNINVETFADSLLAIADLCMGAVYSMPNNSTDREYLEELKNALIQMLACLAFSLASSRPNRKMFDYFPKILDFIVSTCSKQADPTLFYQKSCLYLIFDLGSFCCNDPYNKDSIHKILNQQRIYDLLDGLEPWKGQDEIRELKNFIQTTNLLNHVK